VSCFGNATHYCFFPLAVCHPMMKLKRFSSNLSLFGESVCQRHRSGKDIWDNICKANLRSTAITTSYSKKEKLNSVAWVRERTIPTEPRGQRDRSLRLILGFLDRSCYFFFQVAPQLYSRGWVDPFPDPLVLRKSVSAGRLTRTSGSLARNSDY
jgi:hypothetical protein